MFPRRRRRNGNGWPPSIDQVPTRDEFAPSRATLGTYNAPSIPLSAPPELASLTHSSPAAGNKPLSDEQKNGKLAVAHASASMGWPINVGNTEVFVTPENVGAAYLGLLATANTKPSVTDLEYIKIKYPEALPAQKQ